MIECIIGHMLIEAEILQQWQSDNIQTEVKKKTKPTNTRTQFRCDDTMT